LFEKLFFYQFISKKKCNENDNIYFSTKFSILFVKYDNKEKLMTSNGTPQFWNCILILWWFADCFISRYSDISASSYDVNLLSQLWTTDWKLVKSINKLLNFFYPRKFAKKSDLKAFFSENEMGWVLNCLVNLWNRWINC